MLSILLISNGSGVSKPQLHHWQVLLVSEETVIKYVILSEAGVTVTWVVTEAARAARLALVPQSTGTLTGARGRATPVTVDQVSTPHPPAPAGDIRVRVSWWKKPC